MYLFGDGGMGDGGLGDWGLGDWSYAWGLEIGDWGYAWEIGGLGLRLGDWRLGIGDSFRVFEPLL